MLGVTVDKSTGFKAALHVHWQGIKSEEEEEEEEIELIEEEVEETEEEVNISKSASFQWSLDISKGKAKRMKPFFLRRDRSNVSFKVLLDYYFRQYLYYTQLRYHSYELIL